MTTAHPPKKPASLDWHPADIVAALRKAGWSLRRLSTHHGYGHPATLQQAIQRPYPKAERLIAEAIGVEPSTIWPSRYAGKNSTARRTRGAGKGRRDVA